jgi:hypothetical protein
MTSHSRRNPSALLVLVLLGLASLVLLLVPPSAHAAFGLLPGDSGFAVTATEPDDPAVVVGGSASGGIDTLAGSHPYALSTTIGFNPGPEFPGEPGVPYSDGDVRNLRLDLSPGVVENPEVVASCSTERFNTPRQSPFQESLSGESCPDDSQIGLVTVDSSYAGGQTRSFGLFNLTPQPGTGPLIGFNPYGMPITFNRTIDSSGGVYRLALEARDVPQELNVSGLTMTFWGNPWSSGHDLQRGDCLNEEDPADGFGTAAVLEPEGRIRPVPPKPGPYSTYVAGTCSVGDPFDDATSPRAYLTLPTVCEGPLSFELTATSWQGGPAVTRTSVGHDGSGPLPLQGCDIKSFRTAAAVQPLTDRTSTSAGLNFDLDVDQSGLLNNVSNKGRLRPGVQAPSQVKRAVVTLPEGVTVNPSVAAGLGVCTPNQYAVETAASAPGAGCPNASKIGEVSVDTPLFEAPLTGGLFLAQPYRNPFNSLLALYLVAKLPQSGVLIKLPAEITPDPLSGRLTATFEDLPQLPYTHFRAHFREGQRSLMATPASCGDYRGGLDLVPWIDQSLTVHDDFFLTFKAGIGGGPCPAGPTPFTPTAPAGDLNRTAGAYSPFYLRPTRSDGEQEFTSYSAKLPPGLLGRIAGIPFCPDAALEAAKLKTGLEEEQSPSCPAASSIGHTIADYGLGSTLTHAPGGLYLAGPYHGDPLSIVAVDSATVGPFDLGVIVVRSAIDIDPRTSQVTIDSAGSDPIPHIIKGIPLHLRNIRVYISRAGFTLNPTSCAQFSIESVLTGSGARFSDPSDDVAALASTPFQVSDCSSLGFRPKLALRLRGGTKRGKYPALTATVTPRPGDANIARTSVALPPSEFLAQEHIKTICTQVQFTARRCPPSSVYGHARAITPLLDEPLEGPVYLRASRTEVPDLVADITGRGIRIEVVGRIDSVRGGMRATYEVLPDAPVSKFSLTLLGGKRGLLVNSDSACGAARATARIVGQNNLGAILHPPLINPRCRAHKRGAAKDRGHRR